MNFLKVFLIPLLGISSAASAAQDFHAALGMGSSFNQRQLSPSYNFTQVAPELVGLTYFHWVDSLWLRPAARFSYSWNQPSMARAIHIAETDWKGIVELGAVWSWVVVPSISVGFGSIVRTTSLETTDQIQVSDNRMGRTAFLPLLQFQLGVGIPIEKGIILLEPYARYLHIFDDSRYNWASGVEATASIF